MPGSYSPFARRAYALPPARGYKPPTPSKGGGWWIPGSQLDLDFANNRAFNRSTGFNGSPNGILTYTSPSPKLVYGDDGVLGYAPHNVFTYSEQFDNAAWTKPASSITANSVAAPDGTTTADTLTADAGTGIIPRFADVNVITANGAVHTASIYAKAGTYSFVQFYLNNQGAEWVNFTLSGSGTVSANGSCTATITALSGGWYRLTMTYTAGSTDRRPFFMLAPSGTATRAQSWNPAGTESVYFWGAQLNLGSSALTYVPTTSAAVYSLPIDHDPITHAPLGVLIEEQRTNLLTYSEQFDNAAWTKESSTSAIPVVNPNQGTAPDGTMTADKITFGIIDAAGDVSIVRQSITSAISAYSGSIYLKAFSGADVGKQIAVYVNDGSALAPIYHTLTAGWVRVVASKTTTAAVTTYLTIGTLGSTYGGVNQGAAEAFVWGAQLEAGAFATSYIPTVASQVTRAADQVTLATSAFGYNETAGTVAVEAQVPSYVDAANGNYFFSISDGTQSNLIHIAEINGVRSQIVSGAAVQFDSTVGAEPATDVFIKAAVGYAADDMRLARGGSLGTADTSGTVPSGLTILRVGVRGDANFITYLNGHIKRLTYFSTRKTDSELQALSA